MSSLWQLRLIWLLAFLNASIAIVSRDLVLTPKQGLQLNGKRIYYEEEEAENITSTHNQTLRPWERTLKHVTYVTLFTTAATTGNISELQSYNEFLHTPYIKQLIAQDTRFGDIITLASGRLEKDSSKNNSFLFIEGHCDYLCADDRRVLALWQVQKIRHRNENNSRKFHYEMKFSISPVRNNAENVTNSRVNGKRMIDINYQHQNKPQQQQVFIQKEDDYPRSFRQEAATHFAAERRYYEQQQQHQQQQLQLQQISRLSRPSIAYHPMADATFMRGIMQPPPPPPPPSPRPSFHFERQRLNIGEYQQQQQQLQHQQHQLATAPYKTATPKIELFPQLLQIMTGGVNGYATPTTYRPNYQFRLPKPEIFLPRPEIIKYDTHTSQLQQQLLLQQQQKQKQQQQQYQQLQQQQHDLITTVENEKSQTPSLVTHHFHHHFYMPGKVGPQTGTTISYKTVTPDQYHFATQIPTTTPLPKQQHHPTFGLEFEPQQLIRVTPPPAVPTLKKPQISSEYQKVPLLIYPAPIDESQTDNYDDELSPSPRITTPFVQSEPMNTEPIRYSEPDPLYLHVPEVAAELGVTASQLQALYEVAAPQLEPPKLGTPPSFEIEHEEQSKKIGDLLVEEQVPAPTRQGEDDDVESDEAQSQSTDKGEQSNSQDLATRGSENLTEFTTKENANNKTSQHIKNEMEKSTTTTTTTTTPNPTTTPITTKTSTTTTTTIKNTNFKRSQTPLASNFVAKIIANVRSSAVTSGNSTSASTTTTTNTTLDSTENTISTSTSSIINSAKIPINIHDFVSTSTTETPLRAIGRYRPPYTRSTTTTERAVLKWAPRNKQRQIYSNSKASQRGDNKPKASIRHEAKLLVNRNTTKATTTLPPLSSIKLKSSSTSTTPSAASSILSSTLSSTLLSTSSLTSTLSPPTTSITIKPTISTIPSAATIPTTQDNEIFEVLTQKSVSKSVSIKVGPKGEEIPIIVEDSDDDDDDDGDVDNDEIAQKRNVADNIVQTESNEKFIKEKH